MLLPVMRSIHYNINMLMLSVNCFRCFFLWHVHNIFQPPTITSTSQKCRRSWWRFGLLLEEGSHPNLWRISTYQDDWQFNINIYQFHNNCNMIYSHRFTLLLCYILIELIFNQFVDHNLYIMPSCHYIK